MTSKISFVAILFFVVFSLVLSAHSENKKNETVPSFVVTCVDQKGQDVLEGGGGPSGSHWNSYSLICDFSANISKDDSKLSFVNLLSSFKNGDKQTIIYKESLVLKGKSYKGQFILPDPFFEGLLISSSKDAKTGAEVYKATVVTEIKVFDILKKNKLKLSFEKKIMIPAVFSFGE